MSLSSTTENYLPTNVDERILSALKKSSGYATLSFIARETGFDRNYIREYLKNHSDLVRTSHIICDSEEVYMINTPMSAIIDIWNALCNFNSKKYSHRLF